ncbi:uncharacterized protein RHO25_000246 [Cercospora beticola]|uniref:Uncharacterized protein n=1 Tax=Cercospora beticola TaxID=122368 RepID=A0ABZ0N7Y6_CERBT|nr:hypothetical protein RHO25_000246 [Cercospora beticola]
MIIRSSRLVAASSWYETGEELSETVGAHDSEVAIRPQEEYEEEELGTTAVVVERDIVAVAIWASPADYVADGNADGQKDNATIEGRGDGKQEQAMRVSNVQSKCQVTTDAQQQEAAQAQFPEVYEVYNQP